MGCNQSSNVDKKGPVGGAGGGQRRSTPMTKTEIDKRIDSINETRKATFGGVSVRYAYLSQRGYYPDGTFCLYEICVCLILFWLQLKWVKYSYL